MSARANDDVSVSEGHDDLEVVETAKKQTDKEENGFFGKFVDPFFQRHFDLMREHMALAFSEFNPSVSRESSREVSSLNEPTIVGSEFKTGGSGLWTPRVGMTGTANSLVISAELPGVTRDQVKVKVLDDDKLVISGEKVGTVFTDGENYHQGERFYGSFERILSIPKNSDLDHITSKIDNGVLEVTIPKKSVPEIPERHVQIE
ncbi:Small heat shock protein C4 [Smittium mucronatum]|uniref:Small heat shock protein C4 n=1 Tax=Smittium mucronatum TaxID=133383 RepID=A0A1R0H5C9_9FUNG|nr:Small heat shock protein C4 [Smittium mucronatum]